MQIARLPPIEDCLGDIRRQTAEADEPHEIGALPLPLGKCSKRDAIGERRVELARPEQQRDNGGSGFAANGSVPSIPILNLSRLARRSRNGTDRISVSSFHARARLFTH